MKVLWFTSNPCSSARRDGRSTISGGWHSTLEEAVKDSVELSIAYLSPDNKQESFDFEGVKYHTVAPFASCCYLSFRARRLMMSQKRQNRRILRSMREIIEKEQPDLIHIHGTERCFGLICSEDGCYKDRRGRRIPILISIQGIMSEIVPAFFGTLDRSSVAHMESFKAKIHKQSTIRLYKEFRSRAAVEKQILGRVKYVAGRTLWDREITSQFNPSCRYFEVGEIMRGAFFTEGKAEAQDLEKKVENLLQEQSKGKEQPIRLVSTLSTGPYKGFDNLLLAAAELVKKGIWFSWVAIGYNKNDEYVRITEQVLGLSSEACHIVFAGRCSEQEVAQILRKSDIYCQVSHIENSPNSLCEAMLCSLPSVATKVGGTASMLSDREHGILVPDARPDLFAEAIMRLKSDPAAARQMGEAARKTALNRHAPDHVKAQLLAAYEEILRENQ